MEDEQVVIDNPDEWWDIEQVLDDIASDITDVLWGFVADLLEFGAELIEQVPVPEFISPLAGFVGSVPGDVLYFVAPFELGYGLSVIGAALTARMLLSLLPVVGSAFR